VLIKVLIGSWLWFVRFNRAEGVVLIFFILRFSCDHRDESAMRKPDLEAMDFDELWLLHEQLTEILSEKIHAEKRELEKRLAQLNQQIGDAETLSAELGTGRPQRRKYPKVLPKYCNPSAPEETWSGRGKQPRWLVAALQSGQKLEDFRIADTEEVSGNKVRRSH
jgi:DNA-binding protein H-NS